MANHRKRRASRALPASFTDRTTKSGGKTGGKKPRKTGGVKGFRPGDTSKKAIFGKQ